jgi:hypothetical protein
MASGSLTRRVVLVMISVMTLVAGSAAAASAQTTDLETAPDFVTAPDRVTAPDPVTRPDLVTAPPRTGWSAPALHVSLASGFVALQALDIATTLHGVHSGTAVEANPLVGPLADHPAALIGVKGGLTAATLLSMRALGRQHPRAAVLTMIGLNVGSAFVVRSNVRASSR